MPANLENSAVATGLEKVSFHSNLKERQGQRMFKLLHSFHMLAKECSKFSKLGFNSTWTKNFQIFKLDLEKEEEPEIKLPTTAGSLKKQENSRKTFTSASLTTLKPLTVWITINCGKFWKRWEYQTTLLASWEICMQVRRQQLELDMGQRTGSKLGKEYIKAIYCHLALCRVHHVKCWAGWLTSWNQDCLGEISITSDMQMTPPL